MYTLLSVHNADQVCAFTIRQRRKALHTTLRLLQT